MFKQEDFSILSSSDFSPNTNMENFILNSSQEFDMNNISMTDIIPELSPSLDRNLLLLTPPQALEEATMDVLTKYEMAEFCPESPRGPPERTEFDGDLDFHVEINASDTHKKKYLYSAQLNRIYVDMKQAFAVSFRWRPAPTTLFVRATCVFSDHSQAEKRVERCTQHTHDASNSDVNPVIVRNVLHSSSELGSRGVYYCGNPDLPDSWYSVLVQLPITSNVQELNAHTHAFVFVCKNSCSSGINRRAIDVIFTLEDATGHVYGRQSVGARVCACPRRDMVRDQGAAGGKRRVQRAGRDAPPPPDKKVKLDVLAGDGLHTLPPLQIVGVRAMVTGLEVMLQMMEQAASFKRNDPQATEKYNKSIASLRSKIDELKRNQS